MPSLFDAYVARGADVFFASAGHPADPADRAAAVRRASRPLSPPVLEALRAQNARYAASPARDEHLRALSGGAAAVVTGQQVGLFLGPLYTLYKAATAIRVARALALETGRAVVPVFWLQTEDHDLPEIATSHVRTARGAPLKLEVPAAAADRRSIAHRVLPPEVEDCLAQLSESLAGLPDGPAHLARLAQHYRPGTPWSEAFAQVLAGLFAEAGLVLIDPRDPALAGEAAGVHRRALHDAVPISEALLARSVALRAAGFEPAVHVRADAPLSFVHAEAPRGPRYRLTLAADGLFEEVGGQGRTTLAALLELLDREPARFSTSALLRPLLQDTLLPTAAYVGGPGEVAYLAQVEPLYAAFDRPMPLVVPRARIRVIDDKLARVLERWGLTAADVSLPEDALLARARATSGAAAGQSLEQRLGSPLVAALDALRAQTQGLALDAAIDKTQASILGALAKLGEKHDKALLHRDGERVEDVRRLKAQLFPLDAPQERSLGMAYFAARYGERAFIERVLETINPFAWEVQDLHP